MDNKMEVPKYLYHYTTLNTLGLILKNQSIRFNNLTDMDDLDEADFGGKNWGKYCYISSWTEVSDESIPMWKMYSDNMKGVRIKMKTYPFKEYDNLIGKLLVPPEMIFNTEYSFTTNVQNRILHKVRYDDIEYSNSLKEKDIAELKSDGQLIINGEKLGKWKNNYWEFQKEWRYILIIYPLSIINIAKDKNKYAKQVVSVLNVADNPFHDYYLELDPMCFGDMEVLLGPKTNDIDMEFAQMIVNKYHPSIKIEKSKLHGRVK